MIPNKTDVVEIQSNITGKTGSFSVDENSLAKIMTVLSSLYADPEMAVVREYLSNALDAQIEAQQKDPNFVWRPIEVTTPSHFNQTYTIRDFGTGMSAEDIEEIWSKYGKSTKEHSDDVTGMLGLGSKCGLTYTNQFSVTGFKDGIKVMALVSKDEYDIPQFMIVDTSATTEPNGVEISIPVKDRNSFSEKTHNFLKYWQDGQVLVDGKEPVKHGLKLVRQAIVKRKMPTSEKTGKADVYMVDGGSRYDTPRSYIVMGNVPYAVDAEYVDARLRDAGLGFVAYVPMGFVDFPPNRETLKYTKQSQSVVTEISKGLFEAIQAEKIKEVTDAPDFKTAWLKNSLLPACFQPKDGIKYRSYDFPQYAPVKHERFYSSYNTSAKMGGYHQIYLQQVINDAGIFITGHNDDNKVTPTIKKKIQQYMNEKGITANIGWAMFIENDFTNVWLDHLPRVSMDTIKAVKLPRAIRQPSGPRVEATYDVWAWDGKRAVRTDETTIKVPTGKTLCYISPADMTERYNKSGISPSTLIQAMGENVLMAVIAKNRFDKFLRTHPNAVTAQKAIQDQIDALVKATTDQQYAVSLLSYKEKQFLANVKPDELVDPDLSSMAKVVQNNSGLIPYDTAVELKRLASYAEVRATVPDKKVVKNNVAKRYPLLEDVGHRKSAHLVIYCNAVYDALHKP